MSSLASARSRTPASGSKGVRLQRLFAGTTGTRNKVVLGLGLLGVVIVTSLARCGGGLSTAEESYLDALNNPCEHPEVFSDPESAGCSFSWGASAKELVTEGHQICKLENNRPPGDDYQKVHDYVASRHPDYSRTQINTQLIAAERVLCGGAAPNTPAVRPTIPPPVAQEIAPPVVSALPCPTGTPLSSGAPDWTLTGATGTATVTGPSATAAPSIAVEPPFSVTETQVRTLTAGDGPVVAPAGRVSICYLGVDGRDGHVFDSSYVRGVPLEVALEDVVLGFQKAITGQKVGSVVAVAMPSADGYPQGQQGAGIQPGDSLIFSIKILGAT